MEDFLRKQAERESGAQRRPAPRIRPAPRRRLSRAAAAAQATCWRRRRWLPTAWWVRSWCRRRCAPAAGLARSCGSHSHQQRVTGWQGV